MQHCEQETLALLALGESAASAEDDRHLSRCAPCQSDLASLRVVVTTSRQITPADRPVSPPPAVWDRIIGELGIAPAPEALSERDSESESESEPVVAVVALDGHRRTRWTRRTARLTAAAAFVAVLAGVVGAGLVRSGGSSDPVLLAATDLKPLSVANASGSASIHRSDAGETLRVQISGLRNVPDGFYEVWLADKQTKKMVAVGILDANDQGSFDVPGGLDLAEYRVVDVSLEAFDGNPLHSAISVVRGVFPA